MNVSEGANILLTVVFLLFRATFKAVCCNRLACGLPPREQLLSERKAGSVLFSIVRFQHCFPRDKPVGEPTIPS